MAASSRACAINKCEISSCAVCHCCQNDLCLDHLKEHKDQLNIQLNPLVNQINTLFDNLEHFNPNSLPSFKTLEQWRVTAHEIVEQFYERMRVELFEQKKNKPMEKLQMIRNNLDQLIRKQGATRENINSLTVGIQLIEQEINSLRNIQINLRPLIIDENAIIQSTSSHRIGLNGALQVAAVNQTEPENDSGFQIFVQLLSGKHIFISVKPSSTILEVKRKIEEKEGIPINQQILKYMGKQLMDIHTIAIYDIQKQYTINLSLNYSKK